MKSIALDTLRLQRLGDRQHPRDVGQAGVKHRVEACRLRKAGKLRQSKADYGQRRRNVQRRERDRGFQFGEHRRNDEAMPPKLRSAMHDPVPDGGRRRKGAIVEQPGDADHHRRLVSDSLAGANQNPSAPVPRVELTDLVAYRLCLAGYKRFETFGADTVKAELER